MGRPANLVVNILGNNNDLQRALGQSDSALGKFGQVAGGVMKGVAVGWTTLAVTAGVFATNVFKTGVAYNTLNQTAGAAFKTILGSADAATKMMDDIKVFSKTSPFPRQAFIEATQQMLSFGIETKKVIPYLGAVQDAVAATGGSASKIGEISLIMSQISAAGKITGQDLMQFAQRGINAADLIGSQMGKTGAQIKAEITAGSLDAGTALDALAAGMEARFGGAADNVKQTWVGATDRIKGALRDIGSVMAEPFISSGGGGKAVEWANSIADILRSLEPIVSALVTKFTSSFGGALGGFGGLLNNIASGLKGIDVSGVVNQISAIGPALGALTGGFAAMSAGLGANIPIIGTALKALSGPVGIAIAAIGGLIATSPQLQQVFGGVMQQALAAFAPLLPVISSALQVVAGAFTQVVSALAPLVPLFAGALSSALSVIIPLVTQLATIALPIVAQVITMLVPIVGQLIDAFMPLLPILADLIGSLLPPVAQLISLVLAAIQPLLPVIVQLVKIFVQLIATALKPIMPALVQLFSALTPLLGPISQLIGLVASLLTPILNLIAPILQLAGSALGQLVSVIAQLLGSGIKLIAGIFQGIASAIASVVNWLSKLKWPSPPSWLSGMFGGGGAQATRSSGLSRSIAGRDAQPAPRSMTRLARAAQPVSQATATAGSGNIYLTVNAPYGGGDAIGRAIRGELLKLSRRERGIIIGVPG